MEAETEMPMAQNAYARAKEAFHTQVFGGTGSSSYVSPYAGTKPAGSTLGASSTKGKLPFSALQKGSQLIGGNAGGALGYAEGDRVRHVKFGEGTVKEIKEGGRDHEVTIEFDSVGTRKMFAKFAKLVKV